MQRKLNDTLMKENKFFSKSTFLAALPWIILVLGIVAYVVGYVCYDEGNTGQKVCYKIGEILIVGVIIGWVSTTAHFLQLFKKELEDIIYGRDFLKNRDDIKKLWKEVSKQLFKDKFPDIHKDFLDVMVNYFPQEEISYYNNYDVNLTIAWENKDQKLIKVIDSVKFELVAASKKRFTYPLKTWTNVKDKKTYSNIITEFTVNGEKPKFKEKPDYVDNGNICNERLVELKGNTVYELQYIREKIYNIEDDHYIGFQAKYIVNGLKVSIEYPEDIDVQFVQRGTQHRFEDRPHAARNHIEKWYKGIILPQQGYIFALQQKNV